MALLLAAGSYVYGFAREYVLIIVSLIRYVIRYSSLPFRLFFFPEVLLIDMYTLQKLLTHKSPLMTQRYAHLRDETLKKASNLVGEFVNQAINGIQDKKIVNFNDYKE